LHAARPEGQQAYAGPLDWFVDDRNVYVPDLLVARRQDLTERNLVRPPVLAVEVLSPSTRSVDLVRKRAAYEKAGLAHYWVVDPTLPAVTVLERVGGRLVEVAAAKGDEALALERPFPVTVVPAQLLR
jgi:Uma2 family endonuclease